MHPLSLNMAAGHNSTINIERNVDNNLKKLRKFNCDFPHLDDNCQSLTSV